MKVCTQKDIAKALGISQQAVASVVGNNAHSASIRISPGRRKLIEQTARKMNYRPFRQAQSMRTRQSGFIGMVQAANLLQFGTQLAQMVAREIHRQGYRLLATDVNWHPDGMRDVWNMMMDNRVEGLIMNLSASFSPPSVFRQVRQSGIPLVSLNGVHQPGVIKFRSDFQQGMHDLTRHVLQMGYRRLTFLTRWPDASRDPAICWMMMDRKAGFEQAVREFETENPGVSLSAGVFLEEIREEDHIPYQPGKRGMEKILRLSERPEIVLCTNDEWAIGAMTACREAGVRVPEDMALAGYDDSPVGAFGMAPLTTVAHGTEQMAREAVAALLEAIRGGQSSSHAVRRIPCQLVVRQSCGEKLRGKVT
ncbi:MAG: LacI family DNA-binding transcriptional regulator [Verrucomicrobiae bacterium]|nr:LacI family DNA-binding transcriptional regulator [Verrucomicrobiae bacterium]